MKSGGGGLGKIISIKLQNRMTYKLILGQSTNQEKSVWGVYLKSIAYSFFVIEKLIELTNWK